MESLKNLGNPRTLREVVDDHLHGRRPSRSIGVSFDDGFLDFRDVALPILERWEVPATIFCLGEGFGDPPWWDRLMASLEVLPPREVQGVLDECLDSQAPLGLETLSADAAFHAVYPLVRPLPATDRSDLLNRLESRMESGRPPELERLMTRDELAELATHPLVTIGAHTMSHSSLADLDSEEQFREISQSLEVLGSIIGSPVTTFSFPFGIRNRDYTRMTLDAVERAGLDHAFAADVNSIAGDSDPLCLPRLWVHDRTGSSFARRLRSWL